MRLRVVTWNVHGCVGSDGRFAPDRTARVLVELRPDLVLLQEVGDAWGAHPPLDQAQLLANALEMDSALGVTLPGEPHGYGNVTLTHLPVVETATVDLSVVGREPRVCLVVKLRCEAERSDLRVVNLHLGLSRRERRTQLAVLVDETGPLLGDSSWPLVLGGDLNDWFPSGVTRALAHHFDDAALCFARRPAATFPSSLPLLRLDRLYVSHSLAICRCLVVRSPLASSASDHLPLLADLELLPVTDATGNGGD